ncbi:RCC1 domain-containing protein [Cellulomonas marina]|uniref:Alpha-tubulin suppressor n=1 Tax=Cellulomonas marina TaxID=988821 RepID=A0A1I0WKJ3_9CELL|nr:putative Ig domain-containing protein [Cellulomonas marina]GIG27688.1 hypothetical protein Cma02nite_02880 [Cellulomonas marina]SFA88670.1 Alpha-tubulin suppressor [Cellulomonas marina]
MREDGTTTATGARGAPRTARTGAASHRRRRALVGPLTATALAAGLLVTGAGAAGAAAPAAATTAAAATAASAASTAAATAAATAPVTVTSQAPTTGTVGVPYRYVLAASGTGPTRWAVVSGSLPAGLVLDASGVLSGTPTTAGTATVVLRATNASGSATTGYSVPVRAAAGAPAAVTPSSGPAAGGTTLRVPVPGAAWTQVQVGGDAVLGLADDGSVWTWGARWSGLGTGTSASTVPVRVPLPLPAGVRVTAVAAGANLSLAAASDGSVWVWGYGSAGDGQAPRELAAPTRAGLTLPAGVRVAGLDAGPYHVVVVTTDGAVWTWGENALGQLGDGTATARTRPVRVALPAGVRAAAVDVGTNTTFVLGADGAVVGWGVNVAGALGDGTGVDRRSPVRVPVPVAAGARVVAVAAGAGYGHALSSDGSAYGWGYNVAGQVGDGSRTDRLAPVRVALPSGVRLTRLGAGFDHALGVDAGGGAWWWGRIDCRYDGADFCGSDDEGGTSNLVPVRQPVALTPGAAAVAVDGGLHLSLVVGADGSLSGWGANGAGQLADGTTTWRDEAVAARSPLTVVGVKVGYTYGTALTRLAPALVSVVSPPRAPGVVDVTVRTVQPDGTPGPWTRLSGAWTYTR